MDISKLTVASASAAISAGDFSSVELTKAVIDAVDARDGDICAYLTFDRDGALRQAAEADAARAAGKSGPRLGQYVHHGAPQYPSCSRRAPSARLFP